MPDLTNLVALLTSLKGLTDALQAQLADAVAAAQSAYDKGFADGVASVPANPQGPSQADLDAANAKISELQTQVDGFEAMKSQAVAEAVQSVKDQAKALVDAFEASEDLSVSEVKSKIDSISLTPVEPPVLTDHPSL